LPDLVESHCSTADVPNSESTADCLNPPDQLLSVNDFDDTAALLAPYNADLRIAGAVLRPRESNVEWSAGGQGGCIYATSGDQYTWFNTPVYLPQGSTVKYFRFYWNDQNTSFNSQAYFTIYDLYGRIVDEWGIASYETGQSYSTTSEITHTIDYDYYAYVINWRPNVLENDMQGCGFRLFYHTPPGPIYLPLIERNDP
jgi:hypothetical protein